MCCVVDTRGAKGEVIENVERRRFASFRLAAADGVELRRRQVIS
jgi:hypothetical protein